MIKKSPKRSKSKSPKRSKSKSPLNVKKLEKHGIVYRFGEFRKITGYSKATGRPLTKRGINATKEELTKLGIKARW